MSGGLSPLSGIICEMLTQVVREVSHFQEKVREKPGSFKKPWQP